MKGHFHHNHSKGMCSQGALSLLVFDLEHLAHQGELMAFFCVGDSPLPQFNMYSQRSPKFWLSSLQAPEGRMGSARGESPLCGGCIFISYGRPISEAQRGRVTSSRSHCVSGCCRIRIHQLPTYLSTPPLNCACYS